MSQNQKLKKFTVITSEINIDTILYSYFDIGTHPF